MKTRIKELINREKVTSAEFASEVGIAASSLHHIVSGRNNPSLEVIQKILERFPQINAEWLINGKGNPFKEMVQGKLFEETDKNNSFKSPEESKFIKHNEEKVGMTHNTSIHNKDVEKIIIFYKDKTFEIYQ